MLGLLSLLCALLSPTTFALEVEVDALSSNQDLGWKLSYYHDESSNLQINDVMGMPSKNWIPSSQAVPNFGYVDTPYWLRLSLKNTSAKPLPKYLVISYPLLDRIHFYDTNEGSIRNEIITGDTHPFQSRPINNSQFVFPVTLPGKTALTYYFKVQSQGSVQVPISLWNPEDFYAADQAEQIKTAIYYGMMLIMVAYNLFLFFSLREMTYLYYVGFVFCFLSMMAAMHGVAFQYWYPTHPVLHEWSVLFFVPSTMFFANLFTVSFLNLKIIAPKLAFLFRIYLVLSFLCMLGAFFLPYGLSTRISVFMVILCSLAIFFSGPYAWFKLFKSARYFTVAWFFLLVGTTLAGLNKFGIIPRNAFTENGLQWGSAFEAMLLSFALADRLNRDREARFAAQRAKLEEAHRREQAEQKLFYQASHNSLNGFPNGALLTNKLKSLFEQNGQRHFFLAIIHLRRFHEINKTLGHGNADEVLLRFSKRLAEALSVDEEVIPIEHSGDTKNPVASLEGVLFACLLENPFAITETTQVSLELEQQIIRNKMADLLGNISEPIDFSGMSIDVGISIGIAISHEHGADPNTLIRNAQIAVDVADRATGSIGFYSALINPYSERRLGLVGELRKAIRENQLRLFFQPQWNFRNQRVEGVEALARWHHEKLGMIPPDEFIPLAEKTGIISELTQWVIEDALFQLKLMHVHHPHLSVSVNISAMNLRETHFVRSIDNTLKEADISPEMLTLEITESAIMSDPDQALRALQALSTLGVRLSIDDFGTGHSSLSYIKKLPLNEIKIDRSFVMEMDAIKDDAIIVSTTLNMCHSLGYKVVAEGIESQSVFQTLQQLDCDYAQGYFLTKPLPQNELLNWLDEKKRKVVL